jgi:hypothetical protein
VRLGVKKLKREAAGIWRCGAHARNPGREVKRWSGRVRIPAERGEERARRTVGGGAGFDEED